MTHSILPPSSADMWVRCDGWAIVTQSFPESDDTDAARQGTAAHEVASQFIESYSRGGAYNPKAGDVTSNGVTIDNEMLDACELYADNVRSVMMQTRIFGGPFLGIEQALTMPDINPLSFGTSDCFIYDFENKIMYLWDFKYGFDPVEVFENWQLVNYSAGVIQWLKEHTPFLTEFHMGMKIVFRIAQPRSFHRDGPIREWTTTLGDLMMMHGMYDQLRESAAANLSGAGETQSGSHCKYCPARHGCQSAISAGVRLYEVASQALPLELSNDAIATQLTIVKRAVKHLESIEKALEQQVEHIVRSGTNVPGFRVENKQSRLTWAVPAEEVHALGDMLGIDLRKVDSVTPRQAAKFGIDESVIMAYSHKTSSGVEVVPDTGSKARHIFGAKK